MQITVPNKEWDFQQGDDGELLFSREDEMPYSDYSMLLSFDPMLDEYQIHFSEGADYEGHFGERTLSGDWDGTKKDTESKLRMAEGIWHKWSKDADAKLKPNKRPIPLDPWLVRKVVDEYMTQLNLFITGQKSRFGNFAEVPVKNVKGKTEKIKLRLERHSARNKIFVKNSIITGGGYTPKVRELSIQIHVPSLEYWMQTEPRSTKKVLESDVSEVVRHELTHVRDVIDMSQVKKATKGRSVQYGYVNSPHEVRAYGRQIADAVADHVASVPFTTKGALGDQIVDRIERVNRTGQYHYSRMSRENQKLVHQMVVGRLRDENLMGRNKPYPQGGDW